MVWYCMILSAIECYCVLLNGIDVMVGFCFQPDVQQDGSLTRIEKRAFGVTCVRLRRM